MKKITGYDDAPAYTGESMALPAGKYICVIKGANEIKAQTTGKGQLAIHLDISEGQYKDFYANKYQGDLQRRGSAAKWGCTFRQGYEGNQLPFFKGLITSVEESNPGYKWDWDEDGLKGKKIGVVFGREQFRAADGTAKLATKPLKVRSVQLLEQAEVPADKLLENNNSSFGTAQSSNGFFDSFEEISENDLPF